MTDAPQGAAPQGAAPARARPPRRSPTALDLAFADRAVADELGRSMGDPDWLAADRAEALEAYRRLPIESNPLYTTYVDLRNAELSDVSLAPPAPPTRARERRPRPSCRTVWRRSSCSASAAPSGQHSATRRGRRASSLNHRPTSPDGTRPGSVLRVLAAGALPADDKIAQLTRAFWGIGVHVDLPRGARLRRADRHPLDVRRGDRAAVPHLHRPCRGQPRRKSSRRSVRPTTVGPASGC